MGVLPWTMPFRMYNKMVSYTLIQIFKVKDENCKPSHKIVSVFVEFRELFSTHVFFSFKT